jgi:hypothetical protein
MLKLEKFDGTKTYMFPNGAVATPEVIRQKYPAVDYFTHVIEVNGDVCQAIMNLGAIRNNYKIDSALSEQDAILAIETILNTPPPAPEPSAEERIASAMEYQNMLSL